MPLHTADAFMLMPLRHFAASRYAIRFSTPLMFLIAIDADADMLTLLLLRLSMMMLHFADYFSRHFLLRYFRCCRHIRFYASSIF